MALTRYGRPLRSPVTVTEPTPRASHHTAHDAMWMSFDDAASIEAALQSVRMYPGLVAVWLADIPTRFTPTAEAALWETALRARTMVVPSRCALARVLASGVVHPASVVVVPLPTRLVGTPPERDVAHGAGPLLVTPTALHPAERIDHVLHAMAELARRGVRARYTVVADPGAHRHTASFPRPTPSDGLALWEQWQRRGDRLGLNGVVSWLLDDDPLHHMANAQVVVLPWEADDLVASQALVDAVSLGVPVVASSFPHAVELVPTGAVTVWRNGSSDALHRALHRVLTRPLLRTAMRHAARHIAHMHDPIAIQKRLDRVGFDPAGIHHMNASW